MKKDDKPAVRFVIITLTSVFSCLAGFFARGIFLPAIPFVYEYFYGESEAKHINKEPIESRYPVELNFLMLNAGFILLALIVLAFIIWFVSNQNKRESANANGEFILYDNYRTSPPLSGDLNKKLIREILNKSFSKGELINLCTDIQDNLDRERMSVRFNLEEAGGDTLSVQVIALVDMAERHGFLNLLIAEVRRARPLLFESDE